MHGQMGKVCRTKQMDTGICEEKSDVIRVYGHLDKDSCEKAAKVKEDAKAWMGVFGDITNIKPYVVEIPALPMGKCLVYKELFVVYPEADYRYLKNVFAHKKFKEEVTWHAARDLSMSRETYARLEVELEFKDVIEHEKTFCQNFMVVRIYNRGLQVLRTFDDKPFYLICMHGDRVILNLHRIIINWNVKKKLRKIFSL